MITIVMTMISSVLPDKKRLKTSNAVKQSPMMHDLPLDITPPPSPNEIERIVQLREGRHAGAGLRLDGIGGRGRKVFCICKCVHCC